MICSTRKSDCTVSHSITPSGPWDSAPGAHGEQRPPGRPALPQSGDGPTGRAWQREHPQDLGQGPVVPARPRPPRSPAQSAAPRRLPIGDDPFPLGPCPLLALRAPALPAMPTWIPASPRGPLPVGHTPDHKSGAAGSPSVRRGDATLPGHGPSPARRMALFHFPPGFWRLSGSGSRKRAEVKCSHRTVRRRP